ncbi:hypothetical protein BJX61DRAFT_92138 [Aspergillus egyptiacus]|nr:hypothetical protein BJX61DRAFT_92138 [Aspergillus egyptiacus]
MRTAPVSKPSLPQVLFRNPFYCPQTPPFFLPFFFFQLFFLILPLFPVSSNIGISLIQTQAGRDTISPKVDRPLGLGTYLLFWSFPDQESSDLRGRQNSPAYLSSLGHGWLKLLEVPLLIWRFSIAPVLHRPSAHAYTYRCNLSFFKVPRPQNP